MQDAIKKRFAELIDEGKRFKRGDEYGHVLNSDHGAQCMGWLISASHLVSVVAPSKRSSYLEGVQQALAQARLANYEAHYRVAEVVATLERLQTDIVDGLIGNVADRAAGQTFDSFLDHADAYLKIGKKNEAGVIAGIVFEDTIRRISAKNDITDEKTKLDDLISTLVKDEVITSNTARRARHAAGVRTSAAHARWDEFEGQDVRPVIDLTRELIGAHLDTAPMA